MLKLKDFKEGKKMYYSDFGVSSYCRIELIKVTKVKKGTFWFTAKVIDNKKIRDKKWSAIDSIHSYSNSFIYETLNDLRIGHGSYIHTQIDWILKGGYKLFIKV